MKLRYAPTSPYVRKSLVVAHEAGLIDRIELVPTNPWRSETTLVNDNPLGKVPALTTGDGLTLFDSRVICEYLDSLNHGPKLFPPSGEARWRALKLAALGDGILDAADVRIMESRRAAEKIDAAWDGRKKAQIERALDELERLAPTFAGIDIGLITVGCALGELDFRFPAEDWRRARPRLSQWWHTFAARPSLARTVTILWEDWERRERAAGRAPRIS
ncbi:MAG: glutathione S-transferase [Alphaproteobacteria bacterium]|nr:glutathione S-transferase [Alphaproteobacteria bacterium]